MLAIGWILFIAGGISVVYGVTLNNSMEAQMEAIFTRGETDPGTVWIVIGVLAALIGLLMVLIGSNHRKKEVSQPLPEKKCPHCGASVTETAVFCNLCGKSLAEEPPKPKEIPQPESICPKCHSNNRPEAVFCAKCGAKMNGEDPKPQPAPQPTVPSAPPIAPQSVQQTATKVTPGKSKADRPLVCSHCGARHPLGTTVCKYCGKVIC